MDTLLVMTIFRDEFGAQFLALFVLFLFVKIFHWLSQDRVDYVCFYFISQSFLFCIIVIYFKLILILISYNKHQQYQ